MAIFNNYKCGYEKKRIKIHEVMVARTVHPTWKKNLPNREMILWNSPVNFSSLLGD